jgi:hypothetical protein
MQNALHVQKFHHHSAPLDADQIITSSAAREIVTQKASRKSVATDATLKTTAPVTQQLGRPRRLAELQESPHVQVS